MRTDRTSPLCPAAAAALLAAAASVSAAAAPAGEFDLFDAANQVDLGPLAMAQPYDPYDDPPPPPGGYDRSPGRDPLGDRPFRPLPVEPDRGRPADRGYDPYDDGGFDPYDGRGSYDPYRPRDDYRDPYDDGFRGPDPYDDPRRDVVGEGRDGGRLRVYERPHFVLRGGVFGGIVGGSEDYEIGGDDLSALDGGDGVGGIEGAVGYEWVDSVGGADAVQSVRAEVMYRYLVPADEENDDSEPLAFGESNFHDLFVNVAAHYRYNRVRPFVGIGGGLTLFEPGDGVDDLFDDTLGLGLQGFAGLGVVLTDNLDLEFRADYTYRILEVDDRDFGDELSADLDTLSLSASLVLRL